MNITLKNKIFDGRFKKVYLAILDLDDWVGSPLIFSIDEGNTFKNWKISKKEIDSYPKNSSKRWFCEWLYENIEKATLFSIQ